MTHTIVNVPAKDGTGAAIPNGVEFVDTSGTGVGPYIIGKALIDAEGVNVANVTATGAIKVDGSAVTQPVSGTFFQGTQPISGTVSISGTVPVSVSDLAPLPTIDVNIAGTTTSDAPQFASLTGDPSGDFAGVNFLEELTNTGSSLSVNTRIVNPPKQDNQGAQMMSDSVGPFVLNFSAGNPVTIDTSGYQSISVQKTAATTYSVTGSNDGVLFQASMIGANSSFSTGSGATSAGTISVDTFPCVCRYLRFSSSAAAGLNCQVICYLKASSSIVAANLFQNGSALTGSGGISQSLLIGGRDAAGIAVPATNATTSPISISVVDSGTPGVNAGASTIRRPLSDNLGRLRLAEEGLQNTIQNTPALNVQDISQTEGQTRDEILYLMLLEMRVLNQQLFTLISIQNAGLGSSDEPATLRNDPTLFNL